MSTFALNLLFAALLGGLAVGALAAAGSARRLGVGGRMAAVAAVLAWAVAVAYMTLRTGTGLGVRLNLVPLVVDGPGSAVDAVLNVGVFVPLGALLALLGMRVLPAGVLALAGSLSIESAQYLMDAGRTADVNDLITNTVGALLGWLAVAAVRAVALRSAAQRELAPPASA